MKKDFENIPKGFLNISKELDSASMVAVVVRDFDDNISVYSLGKSSGVDQTFDLLESGVDELARLATE